LDSSSCAFVVVVAVNNGNKDCALPKSHNPPSDDAFAARPSHAQTKMTNKKAKMMTTTDGVWAACTPDGIIALRGAMGGQQRKWNKP
jgi:hypothetical protein